MTKTMNSQPKQQQHALASNTIILIDSDDEEDRKPAAATNPPCISLLESDSDSDNDRGTTSRLMPRRRMKRQRSGMNERDSNNVFEDLDRALAEQLQRRENLVASIDGVRAERKMMNSSDMNEYDHSNIFDASDRALAEQLQKQENLAANKASERAERGMADSSDGKAVLAVQEIIALVKSAKAMHYPALEKYSVEAVMIDDMVYFAKNMLDLQQEFIQKGVSGYIDVGYHYTDRRNMDNIRTHGLLTSSDRQSNQVQATRKGSTFGDGIYTANNGTSFSNFGDTGLIVGRLKGKIVRATRHLRIESNQTIDANTVVGNKLAGLSMPGNRADSDGWPLDDTRHEIVLRSSAQCLPMIKFDGALMQSNKGKECIGYIKEELESILNRLFNKGQIDSDVRSAPLVSSAPLSAARVPRASNPFASFPQVSVTSRDLSSMRALIASGAIRANELSPSQTCQTLHYTAPQSLFAGVPLNALTSPPASCNKREKCVICHDSFNMKPCVALRICNHVFHNDCIQLAFKTKPQCPVCRVPVGEPKGKSPSGTMTVSIIPTQCSGFNENSICITYSMPSGTQRSYHDRPGQRHCGKVATAYLPNNSDGQNLLKRLKFAFLHGLSFTVGTSMTTGRTDQCTWASIHHKTSPSGGALAHGFPDQGYFDNCNEELDGLHVPSSRELDDSGMVI